MTDVVRALEKLASIELAAFIEKVGNEVADRYLDQAVMMLRAREAK